MKNPFSENDEKKSRQQKEYKLQTHIVKKHSKYFPHVIMTHVPNRPSGKTDEERAKDGFFKKQLGVRPGVTDILLWWNYQNRIQAGVVEVKVDARVSSEQNKFMSAINHIGGKDGVVHSWQEYYKLLCFWGITPTSICRIFDEPDTRSDMQKKASAFNWFKPELIKKMDFE